MSNNGGEGYIGKVEIINVAIMKQRNEMMLQGYKQYGKKVKIQMCSSHLADRNMRECKTVWLKE